MQYQVIAVTLIPASFVAWHRVTQLAGLLSLRIFASTNMLVLSCLTDTGGIRRRNVRTNIEFVLSISPQCVIKTELAMQMSFPKGG